MEKLLEILQKAIKLEKEYQTFIEQKDKISLLQKEIISIGRENSNLNRNNKRLESALFFHLGLRTCNMCGGEGGFETEEGGESCPECLGMGYIKIDSLPPTNE